jgi:hypothetical protein
MATTRDRGRLSLIATKRQEVLGWAAIQTSGSRDSQSTGSDDKAVSKSNVHTISSAHQDGHKEFRIDTPHLEHKAGKVGITGKEKMHPAIQRLQRGGGRRFWTCR